MFYAAVSSYMCMCAFQIIPLFTCVNEYVCPYNINIFLNPNYSKPICLGKTS